MDNLEVENFYRSLGIKIRDLRKKNNVNQEQLAKLFGLSRTSVVNIEGGKQKPSIHFIYILAKHFGASLDDIIPLPEDKLTRESKSLQEIDQMALLDIMKKING